MGRWKTSRRYPGVRWSESERHGRIFYAVYSRDGKKFWEKVGTEAEGYTLQLAAVVRGARIRALRHGEELPRDRGPVATVGELAEAFLRWASVNKRSVRDDEQRWRTHLAPRFGALRADLLGRDAVERMVAELLRTGLAPATVDRVVALLRAIWNRAVDWGMVAGPNPAARIRVPRQANERLRFLSREEYDALVSALEERSRLAVELTVMGYHTGGRAGEILRLRWRDVHLERGLVTYRDTKTDRPRHVPLNQETVRMLTARRPGPPGQLLWPARHGGPAREVTDTWQRVADRLFNQGVTDRRDRVVFHTLRHSFISHLVMGGVPLPVVMSLSGHRSLRSLQRYTHLAPGARWAAVELLARTEKSPAGQEEEPTGQTPGSGGLSGHCQRKW